MMQKRFISKFSSSLVFLFYFLSVQVVIFNAYSIDKYDNICKSQKSENDVSCRSFCVLGQTDNLNLSGENIFHFDRFWFGFLNNSVTNPKFTSIDLKSNSPPFKA